MCGCEDHLVLMQQQIN